MNGTVLLILLAVVVVGCVAVLVHLGVRGWRLFTTTRSVQRELLPLVGGLAERADRAASRAAVLGDRGMALSERIAVLQGSVARLTVLVRALQEASAGLNRVRRYLG